MLDASLSRIFCAQMTGLNFLPHINLFTPVRNNLLTLQDLNFLYERTVCDSEFT